MAEAPAQQPSTLAWVDAVREQFASIIVGQQQLLNRLLAALITGNHVLIEGVSGLGKTLSIVTIARCLDASFVARSVPGDRSTRAQQSAGAAF